MGDLSGIIKQLITERDRLNGAIATLQSLNGDSANGATGKRRVSALARRRMAAAQRARWAKVRGKKIDMKYA